ncbi:MAG TPA: nitrilase-related carbon-nitrogen hydrolase [Trebonia sp.]|nr:nitrilase-related carbon-nitrogen hydrolase [Trebonia sp.]
MPDHLSPLCRRLAVGRCGKREPLNIAVAQPQCAAGDVAGNAARHALLVRAAGARVVVFPELSLTGYELADAPAAAKAERTSIIRRPMITEVAL